MLKLATRHSQPVTRPGQSLIETLVAMGLLVSAVTVLMSMVISASSSRSANEYATIAANLAREGVEVVVAKRNDNWINDLAFDNGMYIGSGASSDYTFGLAFDPAAAAWSFVNTPAGGAPNTVNDSLAKVYIYTSGANAGLMVQGTVLTPKPANTANTPYSRLVTLDPICYNGTTETTVTSGSCTGSFIKIGVRITSTVQWLIRGVAHNVSAVETIYDWR